MLQWIKLHFGRCCALVLAIVCTAIGAGLIWQRSRFDNTPSYGILLAKLSSSVWGVLHLVCAALLLSYLFVARTFWYAVLAHTVPGVLLTVWLSAFVIRYATDHGTTVVNVVSWSVYMFLLTCSAIELVDDVDSVEGRK